MSVEESLLLDVLEKKELSYGDKRRLISLFKSDDFKMFAEKLLGGLVNNDIQQYINAEAKDVLQRQAVLKRMLLLFEEVSPKGYLADGWKKELAELDKKNREE